nr:VOC family protein [Citromicrobium sp. JL2201]
MRSSKLRDCIFFFDHIALQAESREEVDEWFDWLTSKGLEVVGPTDHDGLIYSVYFKDPNGIRLEITYPTDPDWNNHSEKGIAHLKAWKDGKQRAIEMGSDIVQSMTNVINDIKRAR